MERMPSVRAVNSMSAQCVKRIKEVGWVQEEGKYLLVIVTVLALAALGILGIASKNNGDDRAARKREIRARDDLLATVRSSGVPASDKQLEGGAEELARSKLMIPPPDEPRVEAIAPKNDNPKVF